MRRRARPILFLPLAIAGCAMVPPETAPDQAPLAYAPLGRIVFVDGPKVTPLEVLEDSRCPINARCVWAGQVRLKVRIDLGSGSTMREITSGKPIQIADGSLALMEVRPDRMTGDAVDPAAYRFGFRFAGGL